MAKGLTIKQEKFCNKYLECGNASEAYRFAYDCSNMSEETIWKRSGELLHNGAVTGRIDYLKSHLAEAAGISAAELPRGLQPQARLQFRRLKIREYI